MDEHRRPRMPYLGRFNRRAACRACGGLRSASRRGAVFRLCHFGRVTALLPTIAAALHVGQTWGRDIGSVPPSCALWRFAVVGALINLAIRLPLSLSMLAGAGKAGGAIGLVLTLELAVLAVSVLAIRFVVASGAKAGARTTVSR